VSSLMHVLSRVTTCFAIREILNLDSSVICQNVNVQHVVALQSLDTTDSVLPI